MYLHSIASPFPLAGPVVRAAITGGGRIRSGDLDRSQEAEGRLSRAEGEAAALRRRIAHLEGLNGHARSHIAEMMRERDLLRIHVVLHRAQAEGAQAVVDVLTAANAGLVGMATSDPSGEPPVVLAFREAFDAAVVRDGHPELMGTSVPTVSRPKIGRSPPPKIKLTPVPADLRKAASSKAA